MAWDAGWWSTASWRRGSDGYAGDIGHVCIDPASEAVCACGNRGCLEALVSAPALVREAEAMAKSRQSPGAGSRCSRTATVDPRGDRSGGAVGGSGDDGDAAGDGRHVGYAIAGSGDDLESGRGVHLDGHPRCGRCRVERGAAAGVRARTAGCDAGTGHRDVSVGSGRRRRRGGRIRVSRDGGVWMTGRPVTRSRFQSRRRHYGRTVFINITL